MKKTYALLILMVGFSSIGNVLLSKGMKQIGGIREYSLAALFAVFFKIFTTGTIWLGILSLLVFVICYLVLLSWADLSFVQPASAIGYAVVPVLGYVFLGEIVPWMHWIAVLFICVGVAFVGVSGQFADRD